MVGVVDGRGGDEKGAGAERSGGKTRSSMSLLTVVDVRLPGEVEAMANSFL